jgi:hypothetical protein
MGERSIPLQSSISLLCQKIAVAIAFPGIAATSRSRVPFLYQAIASYVSKNTPFLGQLKSSNNGTKETFLPIIPSIKIANPTNTIPKISPPHPHASTIFLYFRMANYCLIVKTTTPTINVVIKIKSNFHD